MKFFESKKNNLLILGVSLLIIFVIELIFYPLSNVSIGLFDVIDYTSFGEFMNNRFPNSNTLKVIIFLVDAISLFMATVSLKNIRKMHLEKVNKSLLNFLILLFSMMICYILFGLLIAFQNRNFGF